MVRGPSNIWRHLQYLNVLLRHKGNGSLQLRYGTSVPKEEEETIEEAYTIITEEHFSTTNAAAV